MKLSPPKKITFYVSLLLGLLGFLGVIMSIPLISAYAFWFLFVGYVLLALSVVLTGL